MRDRLKRLWDSHTRVSTQLHIAIWGAIALTVCASVVGWLSFNRVGDAQDRVNEGSIPEMEASFGVAQYSGVLVAAAPRLTGAATAQEFDEVVNSIEDSQIAFEQQLTLLQQTGVDEDSFSQIRGHADTLDANINKIKDATSQTFRLDEQTAGLGLELAAMRIELDAILLEAIDDQLFFIMEGYRTPENPLHNDPSDPDREAGVPPPLALRSAHLSAKEVGHYRYLAQLQVNANVAMELLANAFTVSEASQIEPLRERFEAAKGRIDRNLAGLEDSPLRDEVAPIFGRLFELGIGENDGFDLLESRLQLIQAQRELLNSNREIAIAMLGDVNSQVGVARLSADGATRASSQAILTGKILLMVITGISVAGGALIASIFVGRILVRRLKFLAERMRQMADGDLEGVVEVDGRDEVAEMAAALEVFRRHALEVQRLNLVEQLAEELRGKNDELEAVLEDLKIAQDQIVMRDKLAALGELTAGVAHEIRNPLNFVNNFSEVSQELIKELEEVLQKQGVEIPDEQSGLVDDVLDDLRENLGRIRNHGERANRIVQDMLQMGRDSGQSQSSDINNLLDEHARLAYHSARATDPNFQLDLKQELDPDMGEIEVIPQEIGRVFLNMVSNACYATDEKRRKVSESGDKSYMPTLLLTTKRHEDHVEIGIRDNGSGMPPEVIEKIFLPFFTTKPTDKGTGLGLAMCNDIVRKHGGSIDVESAPNEFTQMTVSLPLIPPPNVALEAEQTPASSRGTADNEDEGDEEAGEMAKVEA